MEIQYVFREANRCVNHLTALERTQAKDFVLLEILRFSAFNFVAFDKLEDVSLSYVPIAT